jgi:UDP-glucose 4-epimerase
VTALPRKAVVTGGAGLIGSHVVELLATAPDAPDEIVVVDDLSRGRVENLAGALRTGRVRLVRGDIRDADLIRDVVAGAGVVFHMAAIRITRCAEEPELAVDVLVNGTHRVVAAVADAGGRLVFSSSASVYGAAEQFPTSERHHPWGDRTLYGAAKTFGEGLLRSYADMAGLDFVALRYFNVYGPRMDTEGRYTEVFIRWMEAIERGDAPMVFGDGATTMDLVYVEDVARANLCASRAERASGGSYNIGTATETSLVGLAAALAAAMQRPMAPVFGPERKVNAVPRRLADVSAAARDLEFTATVGLDEGLARLVAWWRAARALAS